MDTWTDRLTALETQDLSLRSATNPDTKAAWVADRLQQVRARFDFDGVDITPQAVIEQFEQKATQDYDANLRATATTFDITLTELDRDVAMAAAAAEDMPPDPAIGGPDQVRLLATIATSLQRSDAERKLTGKTMAEVLALYKRTPDSELVRVIEEQQRTGWRDVALGHGEDAVAVVELQQAVAAHRLARARQQAPELVEVKARLATLTRDGVRDVLRRFAQHGPTLGLTTR